jgi:hypothetical protein
MVIHWCPASAAGRILSSKSLVPRSQRHAAVPGLEMRCARQSLAYFTKHGMWIGVEIVGKM